MKKNLHFILNLVLILFVSIFQDLYIKEDGLIFKSLASLGFVLLGVVNLIYAIKNKNLNLKFAIMMTIGLFFAMLGDILLEVNFIIGAIFFAIGHIIFFVSYCFIEKFKWVDLIVGGVVAVAAVLVITLVPIFDFGGITLQLLVCIYAVIISLMLGKAITNFIRNRNLINLIIALGSFLFTFSDVMLLLGIFGGLDMSVLCLATYYPAEVLLAISICFANKQEGEK